MSGIFRPVKLQVVTHNHLEEFKLTTDLNSEFDQATLQISAQATDMNTHQLHAKLYDGDTVIADATGFDSQMQLENPILWSDEGPFLYQLELLYLDQNGKVIQTEHQKVGIGKVEIENGLLKLNGKTLLIRGVNKHEFTPNHGYVVSEEMMQKTSNS